MPDGAALPLLLGPQYPCLPKWAFALEYCPMRSEEHRPVGKFVIYAYLSVLEPVQRKTVAIDAHGRPTTTIVEETREHKLLPVRFEETFQVDFADSPFSDDEVLHSIWSAPPKAYSPMYVGSNVFSYGVVSLTPDPPDDSGTRLRARTTLPWHQGQIVASASPSGTAGNLPIIGQQSASGQAQISAGPIALLAIEWILAARNYATQVAGAVESMSGVELSPGVDTLLSLSGLGGAPGRCQCTATVSPAPNTTLADAKHVYEKGYVSPP